MSKVKKVNADKAIGFKTQGEEFMVTEKEALLYATGIGFNLGNHLFIKIHSEKKISSIQTNFMMDFRFSRL